MTRLDVHFASAALVAQDCSRALDVSLGYVPFCCLGTFPRYTPRLDTASACKSVPAHSDMPPPCRRAPRLDDVLFGLRSDDALSGFRPGSGAVLSQAPLRVVRSTSTPWTGRRRCSSSAKPTPTRTSLIVLHWGAPALLWCLAFAASAHVACGEGPAAESSDVWQKAADGKLSDVPTAAVWTNLPSASDSAMQTHARQVSLKPLRKAESQSFRSTRAASECGPACSDAPIVHTTAFGAFRTWPQRLPQIVVGIAVCSVVLLVYQGGGRGATVRDPAPIWGPSMAAIGEYSLKAYLRDLEWWYQTLGSDVTPAQRTKAILYG